MAGIRVSRRTLERTPERAFALLRGFGTCPEARAQLTAVGFDKATRDEGWAQLRATADGLPESPPPPPPATRNSDAFLELAAWAEGGFRRIGAALDHHHPEQAVFFSETLTPVKGPTAMLRVMALLARLDQLEAGRSDRTREADQAALATLAKRGITRLERARLASLVEAAKALPNSFEAPATNAELGEQRQRALLALHAWYNDWATTARSVVSRRDHLIRLGLAQRRLRKGEAPETDSETAADDS